MSDPANTADATNARSRIVLVGDSTVASGTGWGDAFAAMLAPGFECVNLGRGGRSSKSYHDEGFWQQALDAQPAWVLIQFGHNDQPGKGAARETHSKSTFRANLSRYVREAEQSGAQPVLVTPVTRRNFNAEGKIDPENLWSLLGSTGMPDYLNEYVKAVRAVAMELDVPLIDLNVMSVALMNKLGPAASVPFDLPTTDSSQPDKTHLSVKGAEETAKLVAGAIRQHIPALAGWLKSTGA